MWLNASYKWYPLIVNDMEGNQSEGLCSAPDVFRLFLFLSFLGLSFSLSMLMCDNKESRYGCLGKFIRNFHGTSTVDVMGPLLKG